MIHTASLVHDDVVDDCDTRRGDCTTSCVFGDYRGDNNMNCFAFAAEK